VPNYSDNIKIFTVDTFNVLSDLCGGSVPPTPKRAYIPDVATITYYVTGDTTSCIFGYKSEYSTSGYTMLGYLDDENLIEIWQDGTNIMFLSDADIYAPSNCRAMFYAYHDLLQIGLSNFNTANVTDMGYMFYNCDALTTLDLSNFNTANVTDMGSMFAGCSALTTLNLSNFNTANVTTMYMMFNSCSSLTTIYGGDWIKNESLNSSQMFIACTSLVGGNGTHYNSSHTDATYARIDRAGTPGYFTQA
jgi:bacterial surface protein 26-residue repeat